MSMKESEMTQEKERPAGSQSLFRGLMLIEIDQPGRNGSAACRAQRKPTVHGINGPGTAALRRKLRNQRNGVRHRRAQAKAGEKPPDRS